MSAAPPDPGPSNRLLYGREFIRATDQWTVHPTYIGWGQARAEHVGRTVSEVRRTVAVPAGDVVYFRRIIQTRQVCTCGQHDVDAADDMYTQHDGYAEESAS